MRTEKHLWNRCKLIGLQLALMAGLASVTMSDLLAASASTTQQTPFGFGGWIVGLVCYRRRERPIGGWLLYFFWSVFSGAVMTAIFLAIGIKSYLPAAWNGQGFLYSLFLTSTLPSIAVEIYLVVAAIALLRTRSWQWVSRLRSILTASICAHLIALLIDARFFPGESSNLFLDAYGLIFPVIFLPYLFRSQRVQRVFLSKDWGPWMGKAQ
jgi:hypothetical protein